MSESENKSRVLLGVIVRPHGIKGEVKVKSFTEVPADITAYGALETKDGRQSFHLSLVRETQNGLTVRIDGVDDRTAAEALKGTELFVPRERLPKPDADTFYYADLIGLDAIAPEGTRIGTIKAVQNYGAGDFLEIARAGCLDITLVPFTNAFVPEVSLAKKRATVILPHQDDATSEEDADNGASDDE